MSPSFVSLFEKKRRLNADKLLSVKSSLLLQEQVYLKPKDVSSEQSVDLQRDAYQKNYSSVISQNVSVCQSYFPFSRLNESCARCFHRRLVRNMQICVRSSC